MEIEQTKSCTAENNNHTYPFISRPAAGTLCYPFRRIAKGVSSRIAKAFLIRLREWLPAEIQVLDDVCVNVSESLPPLRVDIALLREDQPDFRIDVEIDVPYTRDGEPVHYVACGDQFRDALLSRHGWTVVRFAGQQLLANPKACADYLLHLDNPSALISVSRWTRNEALKAVVKGGGYPEEWQQLAPLPLTEEERQCGLLVKPFPRTLEMEEKMVAFTDAGRYKQDRHIDFEPYEHIYIYDGRVRLLPVSSLIAYFFDEFNALQMALQQYERNKIPVEDSLDKWERTGRLASEVGTFVHAQTENYFRDGSFETLCSLRFGNETEVISVERERDHFLRFVKDYDIHPYRQEWPVYDTQLNIAGTIDMICRNADGTFTIYDWKRSSKVVNALGQPITEGFGGKMSKNGISLPDTSFYHYCIQQNLYRYMLETHYGLHVRAMNLVVLCPDYPTYYVVPVPRMEEVISQVIGVCKMKDLGHYLLV